MNAKHYFEPVRWISATLALAAIVVVYHRWFHVNTTTVALTMLLLILSLAARWGLRYAVAISLAATVFYNFYFLPPVGTLTINDPQNWLALFAFLATAVIGSRLAERAREEAAEARTRQRELEVLYRLSRALLQTENVAALLNTLTPAILQATSAEFTSVYLLDRDALYQAGQILGPAAEYQLDPVSLRQLALTLTSIDLTPPASARIPLRTGVKPRGLLTLRGAHLSPATLEAIAGLVSVSIDRAQALEDVTRGEAAKESERLRTLMIDSITHELRTPLTAIKASATTLLSSPTLTAPDKHDLLTVIDEESDRLDRLVSQAVEMTQLDAQEVHMTFTPIAVEEVIQAALATCASALELHSIELRLPAQLPQVRADRDYLQKVLCNLLENAAKYSAPNTPIIVSAEPQPGRLALHIADRGIGIDASEQSLIFDRFYRARSPRIQTSGTGMGLAISRAIMDAHNGTLSVTSQPGQGTVFTLTLPAL